MATNWKNGIKGGRPLKNPDKTQRKPNHNPEVSQAKPKDNPKQTDRLNGLDRGEGNEETESPATATVCFQRFWEQYPKKIGKVNAERVFMELDCVDHIPEILIAVQQYKLSDAWLKENGRYIPHPANWLNNRGWEDEVPPPPQPIYSGPNI